MSTSIRTSYRTVVKALEDGFDEDPESMSKQLTALNHGNKVTDDILFDSNDQSLMFFLINKAAGLSAAQVDTCLKLQRKLDSKPDGFPQALWDQFMAARGQRDEDQVTDGFIKGAERYTSQLAGMTGDPEPFSFSQLRNDAASNFTTDTPKKLKEETLAAKLVAAHAKFRSEITDICARSGV